MTQKNKDCKSCTPCEQDFAQVMPPQNTNTPDCPQPEPCSIVLPTSCVAHTASDIICGEDTVVEQGTKLNVALENIVDYFCELAAEQEVLTQDINCGEDILAEEGDTLEQAIANITEYFCNITSTPETILEDILCGEDTVISEGEEMQEAFANTIEYFCEKINEVSNTTEEILCGEDTVVPENTNISLAITNIVEYFCERLGAMSTSFIPLSGTEEDNLVTGDIEVNSGVSLKFPSGVDDSFGRLFSEEGLIGLFVGDDANFSIGGITVVKDSEEGLSVAVVDLTNNPNFKGLVGTAYHGANYDDNTYVQKKYVDIVMTKISYGTTITTGGIENTQVFISGGSGATTINLSEDTAVGKDVTVSDSENDCNSNPITIDAGTGNEIFFEGNATQNIVLNTDGASVTLRKLSDTQWMVIAKNY